MRAVSIVLLASAFAGAPAQTPVVRPSDSSTIVRPATAREATALGLKLLGVFDDRTGSWLENVLVRDTPAPVVARS